MIAKKTWINLILQELVILCDLATGFQRYEFERLYNYYTNFLEYVATALYDDVNFEDFIEKYIFEYKIDPATVKKLQKFSTKLTGFLDAAGELRDFDVIRRKEWDELAPLAQECHNALKAIHDKLPDDPEE